MFAFDSGLAWAAGLACFGLSTGCAFVVSAAEHTKRGEGFIYRGQPSRFRDIVLLFVILMAIPTSYVVYRVLSEMP